MAEAILLREGPLVGQVQWLDTAEPADGVHVGGLAELAAQAQGRPLILVWPAASLLLLEIELPLRSAAQIAKALPFALEELLAEDVERYHLSWRRQAGTQRIAVAAVDGELIAACTRRFAEAGLTLQWAVPEPLLLPWQDGQCAMLLEGDNGVFRYGEWLGGGGERELCGVLLERLYANGQAQGDLQLWSRIGAEVPGLSLPVRIEQHAMDDTLLLYAGQWQAASGLNLLVGAYAPQIRRQNELKAWLPAAAILLIALLAQLAGQWQLLDKQRQQLQTLETNTQTLFKQTFPDIKRLVNLKVQADQQLSALQTQSMQQTAGFLPLLYRVGKRLKDQPQFKLRRLQFADNSLHLKFLAPDAASVEQLNRQLSDEDGLQVDTRAVVGVTDGTEADIAIQQN
ncbi:MAG: type II secretion system protein GspL [Methylomonas sp.]|uniref:type II secretion system protein GspL n=1 Tax=Methylomonas sp. TaxID=418 RepID=UPI0025E8DED7|nr:type II secretion system protein GspL [Methylomonas sp.]MCK9606096.1 type II secretion system protein GspL [Methylomonas sp.]